MDILWGMGVYMKTSRLNNLILVVFFLLYFVSPVDLIPDAVPGVGQLDEILVAVVLYLLRDTSNEETSD